MKHFCTISLLVALTMPIRLCLAQEVSAFYTLPEGAFVGTVTEEGVVSGHSSVYIPYSVNGHSWTSTDNQASCQWFIGNKKVCDEKSYTRIEPMNGSYQVPQLQEPNKVPYQYGASTAREYGQNSFAYIGDSVSHYMTPARLFCDSLTAAHAGKNVSVLDLIRTSYYLTDNYDTIGVYFNNIDVMYIEGIRIPVTSNDAGVALFPQKGAQFKATIYPAQAIGGKTKNIADRSKTLATITLTQANFTAHHEYAFTGTLQATLPEPITIDGPFVVELTEIRTSGCYFYVTASQEREGENYWGYHVEGNKETYHGKFTPAISVNAMFPALYPKEGEEMEVVIPAEGIDYNHAECQRTIYANMTYKNKAKGFSHNSNEIKWCTIYNMGTTKDYVRFAFTAEANTTNTPREADFVFSFRGKKLTYHLYQPPQGRTVVRNGLTAGDLGTICLPYQVTAITGASVWEIAYRTGDELVLEESKTMEAGMPYVLVAEGKRIEGIIGEENHEAQAKNGLHGTLTTMRDSELEDKYVMANKQFVKCGSGCELGANRAYLVFEEVPTTATPATTGVRRMAMKMEVTTGLRGAAASSLEAEGRKVYREEGVIYIQVNGQVIGINGQRIW